MFPRSPATDAFWQPFRQHTRLDHDNYVVGSFGDSPEMATELADLVLAGIKQATASLARDYGDGCEPIPKSGDFVMMLDGEGHPRFIWRTIEVTIKPMSQVDEAFAWDEGEGDRTRDWWLTAHFRYFGAKVMGPDQAVWALRITARDLYSDRCWCWGEPLDLHWNALSIALDGAEAVG